MEKVQTMSEKTKKNKKKEWNWSMVTPPPPVHGVWRFSDPLVGPMENAKNQKSEFFFDYGQNVF